MSWPSEQAENFSGTPFVSGALTGRRAFRVMRDAGGHPHLWGPVYEADWFTDRVNDAVCLRTYQAAAHTTPSDVSSCRCGFWAYFGETPHTRTFANTTAVSFGVEGAIFGFGRTFAGSLGFRCQRAKILGLVVPSEIAPETSPDAHVRHWQLLCDAMDKFCDVNWYGTMDALLADWPLSKARKYGFDPDDAL